MTIPASQSDLPIPGSAGTAVVVGAGPGIGASVARRLAAGGHTVALVARNAGRLEALADRLRAETGADVLTATADATDADAVRRALALVADRAGAPTVLCFSPIPDIGLIKPVLETAPEELMASLALNVGGAAAAVQTVVPDMRAAGHGSLLFTTGSAALSPSPERAASAVTTTAATVWIALLRQALDGSGVRVGHTVIAGPIEAGRADAHDPDDVAADLLAHHEGRAVGFPTVLRLP